MEVISDHRLDTALRGSFVNIGSIGLFSTMAMASIECPPELGKKADSNKTDWAEQN